MCSSPSQRPQLTLCGRSACVPAAASAALGTCSGHLPHGIDVQDAYRKPSQDTDELWLRLRLWR